MSPSLPSDGDAGLGGAGTSAVAPPSGVGAADSRRVRRVAIIARARSGTHALGSILAANGFVWFDEVFHSDPALGEKENQGRFLSFCAAAGVSLERYVRSPEEVFAEYVSHLDRVTADSPYILDIKYTSHHYFPKLFHEFNAKPALLSHLRRSGFLVVHIVRENYLEAWISDQIARRQGRWHHYVGDPVSAPPPFAVDINECLIALNQASMIVGQFTRWLKWEGIDHVRLTYEEAFKDDALTDLAASVLTDFLKVPIIERRGVMAKPKRRLRDIIANLGELTEALEGTPFAAMAEAVRLADMQR